MGNDLAAPSQKAKQKTKKQNCLIWLVLPFQNLLKHLMSNKFYFLDLEQWTSNWNSKFSMAAY